MNTPLSLLVAMGGPAFYIYQKLSDDAGWMSRLASGIACGIFGAFAGGPFTAALQVAGLVLSGLVLFWGTQRIFAWFYTLRVTQLQQRGASKRAIENAIRGYVISKSLKNELFATLHAFHPVK